MAWTGAGTRYGYGPGQSVSPKLAVGSSSLDALAAVIAANASGNLDPAEMERLLVAFQNDLLSIYGYDAGIDYKQEGLSDALKRECPDGVDVYFDNVGGDVSAAVRRRLALRARIAICGQVAEYNQVPPQGGPRSVSFVISRRVRMEGFLVGDFAHLYGPALERLTRWLAEGRLRYREDVVDGLENAPRAFIGLLRGENRGKLLVKVADP